MILCFNKIKELISNLNAWLSPIFGVIGFVFEKLQLDILMKIFYILSIYLLFLGILEMRYKKKNRKDIKNKNKIITPKAQKTNELALDTENQAEQVLSTIENYRKVGIKTMEFIKNTFKWIKRYWQQLIGLVGSLLQYALVIYAYIFDKFDFILQYFPKTQSWEIGIKIAVGVISLLFVFYEIRNQVKWVGLGSISKADEYLQQKINGSIDKLDETGRYIVSKALKVEKDGLKEASKKINEYKKTREKLVSDLKTNQALMQLGTSPITPIEELIQKITELDKVINELQNVISTRENKIESYENLLKQK